MMIAAPSKKVEDGGNFSADSQPLNSDDEQLDDVPFLSHQLPDDHESFSEKFLRNILTHDYQNLMPRRREKFVEITKTVTVTEIVNGAPDNHPSSCEVKVTNVSPAGPHPVNVSIKHLHEKWHSCEELDKSDDGGDLGKGTVIRIQETHKPFNYTQKRQQQKPSKFVYEDIVNTKMESSTRSRPPSSPNSTLFNRSSDNIIDLEFRHPILVETSDKTNQKQTNGNGTRRRFADLRKKVSTTTKTSVTETEKVATTRRSSSAHSTSSRKSYAKPEVQTLYYRKFVDEETKGADDDDLSDSGSVIIHRDSVTRRSRSADHLQQTSSPTMSPIAPPRKRLGREESLHYYRDDEEILGEQIEMQNRRRVTVRSPEPGNTSVSMNDTAEGRNITAGITSVSMNDTCTDTSFESRFSTIPRARSSPPGNHRINHVQVNIIGPIRSPETEKRHKVAGRVGEDVTMDIFIERRRSDSNSRRGSHLSHGSIVTSEAPPKPPRRSKHEEHIRIGEPIATSTPMTTIERKQTREERKSTESGQSSRKSTRSSRPPDINIIECETFLREARSPARTPASPIVVINQTPSSRRSSQDLLGEPGQRRRKSTVTDIDWYAAFNMKDPSSPTKLARPPFASHSEDRKSSRDVRRRASDSSMIGLPPADIDLNQIFSCTVPPEIKKDEKCQCNACRLIRMSEAERATRIERASRSRQSRSFTRTTEYETRANTLPSRHRTSPVNIELEDIFNPKPAKTKPPTPPTRRRHAPTSPNTESSFVDEPSPSHHLVTKTIDRKQVTPVTTNSRDSGSQLHENTCDQLLKSSDDWVGQMMNDANEWENRVSSRKSSVLSTSSSTARKASVARRISVDELKKPEKRKSREAVPLPPSDHSIDDIFTALAPKREDVPKEPERKTFIVTRKQRAQDVDIIDFEKDRENPVAPPRSRTTHTSEAKITMNDVSNEEKKAPEVSTASINLEDVFGSQGHSQGKRKSDEDDERIKRRVAEFTKAQLEKEMSRNEEKESRTTLNNVDSNILMDDVFNPPSVVVEIPLNEPEVTSTASIQMRPSESKEEERDALGSREVASEKKSEIRTSAASIDLDKVFVEGSAGKSDFDASDEKIRRGIAEFERAKQEKEAQRTGVVVTTHSNKHLFDDSDISMDDVFNTSRRAQDSNVEVKSPEETSTGAVNLSDTPKESASVRVDTVFASENHPKPSEVDEEVIHIQKRIEEFKKAEEEIETQRTTESHSPHLIFDESNISMDDVFNTSGSKSTKSSEVEREEEHIRRRIEEFKKAEEEKHIQQASHEDNTVQHSFNDSNISMDDVFNTSDLRNTKSSEVDGEEEHIRRRIEEFKKAEEEKQRATITMTHSTHQIFDASNISMDDVFNATESGTGAQEKQAGPAETEPEKVLSEAEKGSSKTNNLEAVFVSEVHQKQSEEDKEAEHIRKRIEEFKRTEEEKHIQQTSHEDNTVQHSFNDSNISMDDVFGAQGNPTNEDDEHQQSSTTTMKVPAVEYNVSAPNEKPKEEPGQRSSAVGIDLDEIFVKGSKRDTEHDYNDERIRRGIAEFERSKQEKEMQRSGIAEPSSASGRFLDKSEISMDDVFSSEHRTSADENMEKPTTDVFIPSETRETSSRVDTVPTQPLGVVPSELNTERRSDDFDLDKVFVEGSAGKSDFDASEEKIRRGIAEFERAKQEKEAQRTGIISTVSSSRKEFNDSNISMDEVFNPERQKVKDNIAIGDSDSTSAEKTSGYPVRTTDEDVTTTTKTTTRTKTETDKTSKRVYGVDPSSETSEHVVTTKTVNLGEGSPIDENEESVISTARINLDDVFVRGSEGSKKNDDQDEKIRRGIVEFEKVTKEKEAQRSSTSETSNLGKTTFDDFSLDDVFNSKIKKQPEESIQKTENTSTSPITMRPSREKQDEVVTPGVKAVSKHKKDEKKEKRTSAASIDLDQVFVEGSAGKSDFDASDEKIRRGIAEFERAKQEKEAQRTGVVVTAHSSKHLFDDSDISMDDVFNTSRRAQDSNVEVKYPEETSTAAVKLSDTPKESTSISVDTVFASEHHPKPSEVDEEVIHIQKRIQEFKKAEEEKETQRTTESHSPHLIFDESNISMDDVFNTSGSKSTKSSEVDREEEHIRRRIEEFKRAEEEKQRTTITETHSTHQIFDASNISMDDVFNATESGTGAQEEQAGPAETEPEKVLSEAEKGSSITSNLETVFASEVHQKQSDEDKEAEHIRKRIEEFKRTEEEKHIQQTSHEDNTVQHSFNDSNISMDDVFNTSGSKSAKSSEVDKEEEHIRRRIEEFKKAEEEKQRTMITESHSTHQIFDASNISMDDVFNATPSKNSFEIPHPNQDEEVPVQKSDEPKKSATSLDNVCKTSIKSRAEEEKQSQKTTETSPRDFDASSLEDNFSRTRDSGFAKTTSESEKTTTTTTTTTRTETTTDSYSKKTVRTLDDLFGPQTAIPPTISVSAISLDQPSSPTAPPRKHQNLSSLLAPGKWNDSMVSNASTISLDDSFNNSFAKSGSSQVNEPKMRKPLTLPVDNWIDNLVSKVTDEATREAPKTPKNDADNYYRSPTRVSQEIKYEWVAKLSEDDGRTHQPEEKEEHQSEEEHLQKQDNTWVSSVVYRPTLETSAYTLRSSQVEPEQRVDIDMDRVFNECLMLKKNDDEECECSACRLTENELEEIKKRKIETENRTRSERQYTSHDTEEHKHVFITNPSKFSIDDVFNPETPLSIQHVFITNPSKFSIDDVFNPETPLSIQTHDAPAPSTSSPPLESSRTYYISPKVSETVTTTHQWKDADISMDEIFSPVSSTTNENRRFSNFYEDRSGWDTIGSEDSGVMSGGDRGRRRSTRITDHVIDEAFKGIFDSQPTTSSADPQPEQPDTQYDDYYITSLHQEDVRSSDSDVDPENLDVSQFVDDILGKSMDEAAFLSSTKSLKDHTDTSIDRKKSSDKIHSYYRTQTDTSIDRRRTAEVINEESETTDNHSHDELLKLVFVDPSDPSISKSESRRSLSLPRNKSITKPSDEELLEIEIKPDYFVIKGSYSLLIPKMDPLGLILQKLREQNNGLATLDFSLTRKLKKLLVNCIRERAGCLDMSSASTKYEGLLSSRGQSLIESIDHASATFLKMNVDKYEPTRNPNGVVNFCTAENNICTPLLEERFKHLELFFPNTEHLVRYPPAGGWPEAREVLVKYFREFMGARVTVEELALTPSTRTGYDVTSYCLFEADDVLLTNGPVYTGTISNVNEKAQCQVACVETNLSNPRLDVKMYEAELNRQIELENTVSGVIIVNPHNPLGVTFPPEEVVNLCNWAASKNLHVVIDEVFANCVFDKPNCKFRPFLSYRHRVQRPENVAWLWSVSKDFGLPGLKFAVIHSANEGLRQAATKLQMYYPCSPFVQDFAINLLSDSDWLREFHAEVNRRISIHYHYTAENLERLEIPFVPAQAGIFVFADFSKHLSTNDSAGELELFERLASQGVMLTPGVHQKCHVFGWFRIVFACTKEELEEGFRRLFAHLGSHLHPIGSVLYDN